MDGTPGTEEWQVRLPCLVGLGPQQLAARSVSLAGGALTVVLEPTALPQALPRPGAQLALRLLLPGQPLQARAQLVGVDGQARAADGRRTVGLTLELPEPEVRARLVQHAEEARAWVMVLAPEEAQRRALTSVLAADHHVVACADAAQALGRLARTEVSALVLATGGQALAAAAVLASLRASPGGEHVPVLLVHPPGPSPQLDELAAHNAVFFFLAWPVRRSELRQAARRAVEACALARDNVRLGEELEQVHARLQRENRLLRRQEESLVRFEGLLGRSAALTRALEELDRVRVTSTSVHLHGETGTGKELAARALHFSGPRAAAPFLAVSCAGVPDSLLQSTLFGHRRGAFTGAEREHAGLFVEAHGGTLFLDEVAELSPAMQGALLRVLETGEVLAVGETRARRVDVRVVSATHADLRERVREGRFREDLYYRLVVVTVRLPPLRERQGDVPLLARHFLALHRQRLGRAVGELTEGALAALQAYGWPGNVRELEHELERLAVLADEGAPLEAALLSPHILAAAGQPVAGGPEGVHVPASLGFDAAVEHLLRQRVEEALARAQGNLTRAAALLGVERSRLGKLRTRLGLKGEAA